MPSGSRPKASVIRLRPADISSKLIDLPCLKYFRLCGNDASVFVEICRAVPVLEQIALDVEKVRVCKPLFLGILPGSIDVTLESRLGEWNEGVAQDIQVFDGVVGREPVGRPDEFLPICVWKN